MTYYFAVSVTDLFNQESNLSTKVSKTVLPAIPYPPANLMIPGGVQYI
jgi:hypothetical protein